MSELLAKCYWYLLPEWSGGNKFILGVRWHAHIPARLPGPPKAAMLLVRVAETLVEATYFAGRAVARTTTSKIAWTAEGSKMSV